MFADLRRLAGIITVKQTNTHIIMEGIPGYAFQTDIQSNWETSRVNGYMFSVMTRARVMFPKFFAVDVLYILETLLEVKRTRVPKRTYVQMIELLKRETWLSGLDHPQPGRLDYSQLNQLSTSLLEHQQEFLEFYDRTVTTYQLNGMLLAAAPGSGKTLTGLALALCLKSDLVIVISPKNAVQRVWEAHLNTYFVNPPTYWHSELPETMAPTDKRFYIFHYEALDRALGLIKRLRYRNPVIILDESHNFNELTSQRTQNFIELCKLTRARNILWSSGTPIKAMGSEALGLFTTLDPFWTKDVMERFKKIWGRDAKRANDILRNRLGLISFKVNKQEIVTIEKQEHDVKVRIPSSDRYTLETIREDMTAFIEERRKYYRAGMPEFVKLYDECLLMHGDGLYPEEREDFERYKRYIALIRKGYDPVLHKEEAQYCNRYELTRIMPSLPQELRKSFKSVRSVIKYVELKILGECLGSVLGKRRAQCHLEMIPHMDLEATIDGALKKTVIFSGYVEVVDSIAQYLAERGYQPLVVHGGTNANLSKIIETFYKNPDANPLVATYQSLSTAVPLICANTEILTNQPFRDFERDQAVSRVLRLGQDQPVHIYNTILDTGDKPNISTRSRDILEWSQAQVEQIMGLQAPADLSTTLEALVEQPLDLIDSAQQVFDVIRTWIHEDCCGGDLSP